MPHFSNSIKSNNKFNTILYKVAVFSIALFIYLSDGFELFPTNDFGEATPLKRLLQLFLGLPIVLVSTFCVYKKPTVLLNPLILFVILKIIVDASTGDIIAFLLEGLLTLVALIVINSLRYSLIEFSIRIWIRIAVFFSILALIKIFLGLLIPEFVNNPALLFLGNSTEFIEFGPFSFGRSSSYASEPSLNVLFFLMPAIAALIINNNINNNSFLILFSFCLLSFSGSFILSLIIFLLVFFFIQVFRFFDLRVLFPYFFFIIFIFYMILLNNIETSNFSQNFDFSETNKGFDKSESFQIRATNGAFNLKTLLKNPLGKSFANKEVVNIPMPLLISVGLAGGWISIGIFIYFLIRLSNQMHLYRKLNNKNTFSNFSMALLIGAMFNFMIFNDYLIINYNGLIILTFISYLIRDRVNRLKESKSKLNDKSN